MAKKTAVKKTVAKTKKTGIATPVTPDAALAAIVGSKPLPRTQIVKKLWDYIKKNKLQDAVDRRNIKADAKLKPIFGGKAKISMLELAGCISKHVK